MSDDSLLPVPDAAVIAPGLPPGAGRFAGSWRDRTLPWLPSWPLVSTRLLELRKRTGLMATLIFFTVGLPVLVLGLRLGFHLADPKSYGPAGTTSVFQSLAEAVAEFGFLVAAAIGASAGSNDLSEGMFRHLVITGRSRVSLYLARLPAGLAIVIPFVSLGLLIVCLVTAFAGTTGAGGSESIAVHELVEVALWVELVVTSGLVVGLGLGSLTGQRTVSTVILIALELIVTPILDRVVIPYFINGQRLVVGVALDQLRPALLSGTSGRPAHAGGVRVLGGGGAASTIPPMPTWAMVAVIAGWWVCWTVVGAWRMATRDA